MASFAWVLGFRKGFRKEKKERREKNENLLVMCISGSDWCKIEN